MRQSSELPVSHFAPVFSLLLYGMLPILKKERVDDATTKHKKKEERWSINTKRLDGVHRLSHLIIAIRIGCSHLFILLHSHGINERA